MKNHSFIPITIALLIFSSTAFSASSYLGTWAGIYPGSTSDDNSGCQLCHAASTGLLNPYGEELCSSNAGGISARIAAVEALNSDADPTGSDNITETNASTQPGWTPGNVNPTYDRGSCNPTGNVEAPPTFVSGSMDPAASNQPPVADANGPYSGTVNVPMALDGSASTDPDGTIVAYDWDFGDGNIGSGATPTVVYFTAGTFTVTLVVTDDFGDTDTTTTTAVIGLGNQPPTADPNGPYTATTGTAIQFDGSGSTDPDGTIASYSWDFGDGNTATGSSPSHTYAAANIYNVTLTVMDDAGAADSATTTATITDVPVDHPPIADPGGPYTGTAGVAVAFDGSASTDAEGALVSYDWDFGDGSTGTGVTPSHTYTADGIYTVILTVTDSAGATDSSATTATIGTVANLPPVADPNGPYNGTVGVAVVFDNTGSFDPDGTIVNNSWDFGDGNTGTGGSPSHAYAAAGVYTVTLTVTDDAGATDSASTTATIGLGNLPPVADANGPYSGKVGVALTFDGSGSSDPDGSITSYSWDFGDGASGIGVNPSHTYTGMGLYNVTLVVTDDTGMTDSDGTTATIKDVAGGGGHHDDDDDDDEHGGDHDHDDDDDDDDHDHDHDDDDDDDDNDHHHDEEGSHHRVKK